MKSKIEEDILFTKHNPINPKIKVLVTCCGSTPAISVIKALREKPEIDVYVDDLNPLSAGFHMAYRHTGQKVDFTFPILNEVITPADYMGKVIKNRFLWINKVDQYIHAKENDVLVPLHFPKIIKKPEVGMGSKGQEFMSGFVQEFIEGIEYTVDIIATKSGILGAIPKLRIATKDGQSVKAKTVKYPKLQSHAMRVAEVFQLNGPSNIQFIERKGEFYMIEVNTKFAASLALTTKAGVNIPWLLIKSELGEEIKHHELRFKEITMLRYWEEVYV